MLEHTSRIVAQGEAEMSARREVDGHDRTGFEWCALRFVVQLGDPRKGIECLWDCSTNFDYFLQIHTEYVEC